MCEEHKKQPVRGRKAQPKPRELSRLLSASKETEKALLLAAQAFSQYLAEGSQGEPLTEKKIWADNLNHLVSAIGKQAETRMMLSGILGREEEEKLELMRRKQTWEEQKEAQEGQGGAKIVLAPEAEALGE